MLATCYPTHRTPWLPELSGNQVTPDSAVAFHSPNGSAFGLNRSDLAKGVYLVGAPRSGKSTVLCHILRQLIPNLGPHDSLLVFDPRGEFSSLFYRPGDWIIDPRPNGCGNASWNLFADLTAFVSSDGELSENARIIAERLCSKNQNILTPFFEIAPRRLLEMLLFVYGKEIQKRPHQASAYTTETLLRFCANLSREHLEALITSCPASGELRSYLGDCSSNQALGVLGEFQASISFLNAFANSSLPCFSASQFAHNGGGHVCYILFDASSAAGTGSVIGLILDLCLGTAVSSRPQEGKFYACIDELPLLGNNIERMQRALSFGAGQHLGGLFCAAQSNAQLEESFGKTETESLLADFGTVIALRTNDETTRQFVQKRGGQITVPLRHAKCGVLTCSLQNVPSLPDDQLLSMKTGDSIIFSPPTLPFSFHFAPFFKREE